MERTFMKLPRRVFGTLALTAAIALVILAGCSDDDNPTQPPVTPPPSTSMSGAFLSGTANGSISVTINSTSLASPLRTRLSLKSVVTASGTLKPTGSASVSLTGTYNTETDSLYLSGGTYAFAGQADTTGSAYSVVGGWTGPGGPGVFGCFEGSTSTPVKVYCGAYENTGATSSGNFDLLIYGDDLGGLAFPSDANPPIGFEGTVTGTGTVRTINFLGNDGDLQLTGTGTLDTSTNEVSGTWQIEDTSIPAVVDEGTWSGSLCQ